MNERFPIESMELICRAENAIGTDGDVMTNIMAVPKDELAAYISAKPKDEQVEIRASMRQFRQNREDDFQNIRSDWIKRAVRINLERMQSKLKDIAFDDDW